MRVVGYIILGPRKVFPYVTCICVGYEPNEEQIKNMQDFFGWDYMSAEEYDRMLNGCGPVPKQMVSGDIADRYRLAIQAAEEATGWTLTGTRTAENSTIRAFISYYLHKEGYSYGAIGRVMHRNHSTIMHLVKKMQDMFSLPEVYKDDLAMYNAMIDML